MKQLFYLAIISLCLSLALLTILLFSSGGTSEFPYVDF